MEESGVMRWNSSRADARIPGIILFIAVLTITPAPVFTEAPAKSSPKALTEASEEGGYLQGLNSSLTGTLELTVRFIGKYRVGKVQRLGGELDRDRLKMLCDESGYDTVLFGETEIREDDSVVIRLAAYDRGENEVSAEQIGVAESLLSTFETTDRLVASLVEEFSDVRVEYGRMRLVLRGADTEVDAFLDGEALDASVFSGLRMVAGEHRLSVQRAIAGEEEARVYFSGDIEIRAGEMNEFRIDVPLLSEGEKRELTAIDRRIAENWGRENGGEVNTAFREAEELLDKSPSTGAARVLEKYETWRHDYDNTGSVATLKSSEEAEKDPGVGLFYGRALEAVFRERGVENTPGLQVEGDIISEAWRRDGKDKLRSGF